MLGMVWVAALHSSPASLWAPSLPTTTRISLRLVKCYNTPLWLVSCSYQSKASHLSPLGKMSQTILQYSDTASTALVHTVFWIGDRGMKP